MFQIGQQIGIYTLIRKLGQGGFGEVWLAEKTSESFRTFSKKVALKLPHREQVDFNSIEKEANLWEQASGHPNVLPIIDADVIGGQIVIVSEFADGGSIADKLSATGKIPFEKAVEYTRGILSGLQFLHSKEIIHRDIKPQNILLQGDIPRLADFGISRMMNTNTFSAAIVGTDAYMSPEALDGERSVQTDIWSVGVVLYQMIEGRLPFPQRHRSERMFAILSKEFAPLSPNVPPKIKNIITRTLAKNPAERYASAAEMNAELQNLNSEILRQSDLPQTNFPTEVLLDFELEPKVAAAVETGVPVRENRHIVTEKLQIAEPANFASEQIEQFTATENLVKFAPTVETVQSPKNIAETAPKAELQTVSTKSFPKAGFIAAGALIVLFLLSGILLGARWLFKAESKPETPAVMTDGANDVPKAEPNEPQVINSSEIPANTATASENPQTNPIAPKPKRDADGRVAPTIINDEKPSVTTEKNDDRPRIQGSNNQKNRRGKSDVPVSSEKLSKDRLFDPDKPVITNPNKPVITNPNQRKGKAGDDPKP